MTEQMRKTILAEQQLVASKQRFGLFSQPPPIAIGDNSAFQQKIKPRGQNGKPITSPPQLLSGQCRSGQMKSSYIDYPESIYVKDPFKQQFKVDIQYERQMHTRAKFHENQFKPASGTKTIMKAAYNYVEQKNDAKKPIKKDQNGRVKTQPRNFTSNPISKVESDFFKHPKHVQDPYERKKNFEKKEHQVWKSKLQENSWKSMSHAKDTFQKIKSTYGEDEITKKMLQQKKAHHKTMVDCVNHQGPFKPAIRGHGDPIDKFPKFIEPTGPQIPKQNKRQRIKTQQSGMAGKQKWKSNGFTLSRPTPSISLNRRNLGISRSRYH